MLHYGGLFFHDAKDNLKLKCYQWDLFYFNQILIIIFK